MMLKKLHLGANPIIVKELRSRMRDSRAFITLTLVLLLLGGSSYLVYQLMLIQTSFSGAQFSPQIGQTLFIALALLELLMVSAIAPAVTSGAISSEREKLTYEMLVATPLKPSSILWGKLVSALSYVFLLIFAAIPMASLIFIFGGVTIRDMIKVLIVLFVVAITLGMIGLFLSTALGRTSRATVVSYMVVGGLFALPVVAYIAMGILRQAEPPRWLLVASPVSALFSAISSITTGYGMSGYNFLWSLTMGLGGNLGFLTGSTISTTSIPRPLYHYSLPFYGLLTLVLYMLSSRLILPTRRWHVKRKDLLLSLLALLLVVGLVGLAFWATSSRYENASIFTMPDPPMPQGIAMPAMERVVVVAEEKAQRVPGDQPEVDFLPMTPEEVMEYKNTAGIYAAVVEQLYSIDHPRGQAVEAPNYPVVYLTAHTDDGVGDPDAMYAGQGEINGEIQQLVVDMLTSREAFSGGKNEAVAFKWITTAGTGQSPVDIGGSEESALIIFGNIHAQNDGSVMVSASIADITGASGKTFRLGMVDGSWQIIGDTGIQWNR